MNNANHKIITELGVVVEHYFGAVNMEDIIALKREISFENNYSPSLNLIMDFQHAKILFDTSALSEYVAFAKNYKKTYGKRNTAFLTNSPTGVVLSTIFELMKGDLPVNSDTFSTLEAVTTWFRYTTEEFNIIKTELESLRHKAHLIQIV